MSYVSDNVHTQNSISTKNKLCFVFIRLKYKISDMMNLYKAIIQVNGNYKSEKYTSQDWAKLLNDSKKNDTVESSQ